MESLVEALILIAVLSGLEIIRNMVKRAASFTGSALKRTKTAKGTMRARVSRAPLRRAPSITEKMIKKVMLKSSEPKTLDNHRYGQVLGQVSGATGSGHIVQPVYYPDRGTGSDQRVGNRCTFTGMQNNFSFWGMNQTSGEIEVDIQLVQMKGPSSTAVFAINELLEFDAPVNAASVAALGGGPYKVYDVQCLRDNTNYGAYKVLGKKRVTLPQTSNGAFITSISANEYFNIPDMEVEFDGTTGDPTDMTLYWVLTCNRGNASLVANSTLQGIPDTALDTGIFVNWQSRLHFKDL